VIRGQFLSGLAIGTRERFLMAMRIISFALIFVASRLLAAGSSDIAVTRLLVGNWDFRSASPTVKEGTFTFRADGTFSSHGLFHVGVRESRIDAEGTWQVKNGVLTEKLTQSNDPTTIHIGQITRDKVLSITNKKVLFETEEGRQISYVRK
jgi:hypothetical protein